MILLFKDQRRYPLAGILGRALSRTVERAWPDLRFDLVVPVPGSLSRRLKRGFEPAGLVACEAASVLGVSASRCMTLRRDPKPQKGLTAVQRRENLRGVFAIKPKAVDGKRVLLVDDVTTTGTTLREASQAIRRAGATVFAATLAMTPERALDMMDAAGTP